MPFLPVWMEGRGLSAAEIGIVLSATMWVRVVVNPLATDLADRTGERRRLVSLLAFAAVLSACLFLGAHAFWTILAVAILHTAFQGPVMPLSENVILLTLKRHSLDYGRLRLWGSLAFIVTSMGGGWLIEGRSTDLIMVLIVAFVALVFLATCLLPDIDLPKPRPEGRGPMREIVTNRIFLLFVLAAALNLASHSVLHGFASLHWRQAGISDGTIGMLWAVGVVAEIALFAVGGTALRRVGVVGLMALGAGAGVVRWTGLALTTDVWLLIPIQALHGLTFGATHLGAMHFIQGAVPARLSASAQGLYSSLGMGLAVGVTLMLSGVLYERMAGNAYLVMTLWSLASLLALRFLARSWRSGQAIA